MITVKVMDHTGDSTSTFTSPGEAAGFIREQMGTGGKWATVGGRVYMKAADITESSLEGATDVTVSAAVVGG